VTDTSGHAVVDAEVQGIVFDIDTFAVHDGPGIRMTCYLKGCPLSCAWCHSPESQSRDPELVFVRDRCIVCGACVAACPHSAQMLRGDERQIIRDLCRACGTCVTVCPTQALAIRGYSASASEIVARAVRMKPFFEHSDGGVTLTGGEVTMQPEFARAILAGCRAEGIHTAIETCGACTWSALERLLPYTDLILYDLKLFDEDAHRRWTGASNRRTLENARRLAGYPIQVRIPLIPGLTDTEDNLSAIFCFMRKAGLQSVALLPYNEAAPAKYEWLDRDYGIDGTKQTAEQLDALCAMAKDYGLEAVID